ncbi:LysR family transcriptional regulator [Nannocystis punicea]|uniref:LysR family transcriptional regulator n=1 Tax=Nannocystis punicea TaxID=2995304 RepID=A0ABY7H198_9BACT|nr:LysR family transcriptional regulator [Nannocystis poenicansa]WAS92799.1 LysR family transcriptional regulator [Nannocystis poenicansa]
MESLAAVECFVHSAEAGSFSAAARKLGVTPAAVSKSVAKLEERLGVRLFQRTTRSLKLTEPGEQFLREAASGLHTLQAAMAGLASAQHEPAGTLRVSMSPTFGRDYILPMLGEFLARYSAITPDWHLDNRQVDLVGENFDAAIGAAIELRSGIVARELARAHIVAAATPQYLARHGAPRSPAELGRHDGIVLRSPQSGRVRTWSFRSKTGEEATLEPRPRIVFNDMEAICQATLMSLGVGLISMPHAVPHLDSGRLVRVLPKWHADAGAIFVYFGGQKLLPAKTRAFVDALVAWFRREKLAERFRADR